MLVTVMQRINCSFFQLEFPEIEIKIQKILFLFWETDAVDVVP